MGFGKGKHMGLRGYHNFVADPKIPGYVVMARRISCLCGGCKTRMKLHIDLRYRNPCTDCLYYPMYQGLNDWIKVSFRAGKDGDDSKAVMANEWTLQQIGKRSCHIVAQLSQGKTCPEARPPCTDSRAAWALGGGGFHIVTWLS